jgi:hypothetical protein
MTYAVLCCPAAVLQYLCCELSALQLSGQLCQLQVFDVAHMAWRLQVACNLMDLQQDHKQVRREAEIIPTDMLRRIRCSHCK